MPNRLVILLALALLLAGCARRGGGDAAAPTVVAASAPTAALAVQPGRTSAATIQSGGVERSYWLHVPAGYRAGQPVALVIDLHGYSSNATQQEQVSQFSAKADAEGFVVVYPQGTGDPPSWNFGDRAEGKADVQFVRDIITTLGQQLAIDPKRVYATGISNGAEMSFRLACDMAGTIAAFGFVAGGYPPFADCEPGRPVPVVAFHGTNDRVLPYNGKPPLLRPVREWAASWAAINGCGAQPAVTLKKGDVAGESWGGCKADADVVLYTITGKGHSWPGSDMPASITTHDINATDVLWDFFVAHPLP